MKWVAITGFFVLLAIATNLQSCVPHEPIIYGGLE